MKNQDRTKEFARNEQLEILLKDLNADLLWSEKQVLSRYEPELKHPLILIMGPMRCGSTLFMQWLANSGLVSVPTNLLSRFYMAPIIGAKIQLLLTDPRFSYRNELGEFAQKTEYKSENGKTLGALSPNEFYYFWRRFLPETQSEVWTNRQLNNVMDVPTMKAELAGVMDVFQRPFATKGMMFNFNIPFLNDVLEKVLFIQIVRDEVENVASVMKARKQQFGTEAQWYSFKVPEYNKLIKLDAVSQCAGQVVSINNAVTKGLATVTPPRKMIVRYEEFCERPQKVYEELAEKIEASSMPYRGPQSFSPAKMSLTTDRDEIVSALSHFKTIQ